MKKYDVVALGELLVDFTDYGMSGQENPVFEANPGGAPCNVLALLRKYNKSCTFIGKIGNDFFGKMLTAILDETGIDHKGLIITFLSIVAPLSEIGYAAWHAAEAQ